MGIIEMPSKGDYNSLCTCKNIDLLKSHDRIIAVWKLKSL